MKELLNAFKAFSSAQDLKMEQFMAANNYRGRERAGAMDNDELCRGLLKIEDSDRLLLHRRAG